MPIIEIDLGEIAGYESLPFGSYWGEIERITYRETSQEGKFAQLQVPYKVIDGEQIGRSQSEWLSMSPKAAFRLKRWFAKFGLGNIKIKIDPDTSELLEPNLEGSRVIFVVREDGLMPSGDVRVRCELLQVDEMPVQVQRARVPAPREPAVAASPLRAEAQAAAQETEEGTEEETEPVVQTSQGFKREFRPTAGPAQGSRTQPIGRTPLGTLK